MGAKAKMHAAGGSTSLIGDNIGQILMVLFGAYFAVAHRWCRQSLLLATLVPLLVAALTASLLAVFRSAKRWHTSSTPEDVTAECVQADEAKEKAEKEDEEDVDPIWMADWTNREEREEVARKLQEAEPPRKAEVFDLNDTPTWLAQMQKRREQAQRAGKDKLVQKLDKEIDQALSKSLTAKGPELRAGREAEEMHHEEDVWSMDWSSWRSFESALPAVAAA
ncbi:unnamed protein product [Symbiodinium necroappetens]|uniref:Uncharacterized protein n=1 Tax=Symbiodinium necroappetens TaxID=1628268 RepID=A0A813AP98_9DINO|nr:unnamed protein product [Symbiodinium necroappetens]